MPPGCQLPLLDGPGRRDARSRRAERGPKGARGDRGSVPPGGQLLLPARRHRDETPGGAARAPPSRRLLGANGAESAQALPGKAAAASGRPAPGVLADGRDTGRPAETREGPPSQRLPPETAPAPSPAEGRDQCQTQPLHTQNASPAGIRAHSDLQLTTSNGGSLGSWVDEDRS